MRLNDDKDSFRKSYIVKSIESVQLKAHENSSPNDGHVQPIHQVIKEGEVVFMSPCSGMRPRRNLGRLQGSLVDEGDDD